MSILRYFLNYEIMKTDLSLIKLL